MALITAVASALVIALARTACGSTATRTETFDERGFAFTFEYPETFGDS